MPKNKRAAGTTAPKMPLPKRTKNHRTVKDLYEPSRDEVYEVDAIVGMRWASGVPLYTVRWTGYDAEDTTDEPIENLEDAVELVAAFNAAREKASKEAAEAKVRAREKRAAETLRLKEAREARARAENALMSLPRR